jgi:endonuclease III
MVARTGMTKIDRGASMPTADQDPGVHRVLRGHILPDDPRLAVRDRLIAFRRMHRKQHPDIPDRYRDRPMALLVGLIVQGPMHYEVAWRFVDVLIEALGHLDAEKLKATSVEDILTNIMTCAPKPRFPLRAAKTIHDFATTVVDEFSGDAGGVWLGRPVLDVIRTLDKLFGVGPGIAHMTVQVLNDEMDYDPGPGGFRMMDMKPDTHAARVFHRAGLVASIDPEASVRAARVLNPAYPGDLDWGAWKIGHDHCHSGVPVCEGCPLSDICPRIGVAAG